MKKKFFKTKDGSPSLIIDELNETYHSRHGAITESLYIYILKKVSILGQKEIKTERLMFLKWVWELVLMRI